MNEITPPAAVTPAAGDRLFTTWVTSLEHADHAVTDEESTDRLNTNRGSFRAICGTEFLPGPMEGEPQPPCSRCLAILRACTEPQEIRTPPRSWWRRLFCPKGRPADAEKPADLLRTVVRQSKGEVRKKRASKPPKS